MATQEDGGGHWDGWLGPRTWAPIGVLLAAAVVALAILLAVKWNDGGSTPAAASSSGSSNAPLTEGRQATHEHADFAVFIDGKEIDYGQKRFLAEEGNERSDAVHLHAPHYTVVHVHKTPVTWDEFFRTVESELLDPSFPTVQPGKSCMTVPGGQKYCDNGGETFKFVVNGVQVDGVSSTQIHDMDRVLISYGPETFGQVMQQQWPKVTDQACILSERCKERIPANSTPEPCSGTGECVKPGG